MELGSHSGELTALESRYRAAVRELEGRGIMPDRPPSLEPIAQALARLELKFDPARTIIVAGTNGKGSVSATLEALYLSAGEETGLYTSPHLVETSERIRLSGEDVSWELFLEAHERAVRASEGLGLSHFEMLTAMAAWIFFSPRSPGFGRRVILEVGLGGIWDATNAIPHANCVITRLGLDHQNLLGSTLTDIARNKFGVILSRGDWAPQGALVAHAPLDPSLQALTRETRARTGSRWVESSGWDFRATQGEGKLPVFRLLSKWGEQDLVLAGRRGAENSALALTAFELFGSDSRAHLAALARVRWPGRMQKIEWQGAPCPVFVSGDHNPQGIESLLELLEAYPRKRLLVLTGIGVDKDAERMLERLSGIAGSVFFLTETPFKGRKIAAYGPWLERAQGAWADPVQALSEVCRRSGPEDLILVTGSLYLVGALLRETRSSGAN